MATRCSPNCSNPPHICDSLALMHLPIAFLLRYRIGKSEAEQAPGDMTALKEYARLESTGLWRDAVDGQRREVGIIFGNASLIIVDTAGRPLTHWSMPAMRRTNPGQLPAIYTPDGAGAETLELADDLMIGAIDKVLRSVARSTPRPRRLRNAGIAFVLSMILGFGIFWLPGALIRQTLLVMPAVTRTEIGATLLGHIQRLTSPTCRDPLGTQALVQLNTRLFGAGRGQIVVIPNGPDGGLTHVIDLPGGIIVLGQGQIETASEPAVLAGAILAATALRSVNDPLEPVLQQAGLMTTLRLLTTGDIPTVNLQDHAVWLLQNTPARPDVTVLVPVFAATQVSLSPWAYSIDTTGETVRDLIAADPLAGQIPPEILTDGDWISLQGICSG